MIKKLIRNIVLGERASREKFAAYLRKQGAKIGEEVRFYSPNHTLVDLTEPWLLTMGDNIFVAHGVTILTHDFVGALIKSHPDSKGELLGAQAPVKIGSNVFIGVNAVITKGVTIGDFVAIGAGSVVTTDCESNSIYAGNPAKKIMSLSEYAERRRKKQFDEAKTFVLEYYHCFGERPPKEKLYQYLMLFCTKEDAKNIPVFRKQMGEGGCFEDCYEYLLKNPPMFESYDAFLDACFA